MLDVDVDITKAMGLTKELHIMVQLQVHFLCECAVSKLSFFIIDNKVVHL